MIFVQSAPLHSGSRVLTAIALSPSRHVQCAKMRDMSLLHNWSLHLTLASRFRRLSIAGELRHYHILYLYLYLSGHYENCNFRHSSRTIPSSKSLTIN